MSLFVPTAHVTILKIQEGTDAYGDETDEYAAVRQNVGVHMTEKSRLGFDPQTGMSHTVRQLSVLLPSGTTIEKGWRLRIEETDEYFMVEHVTRPASFVGGAPVRAEVQRLG